MGYSNQQSEQLDKPKMKKISSPREGSHSFKPMQVTLSKR